MGRCSIGGYEMNKSIAPGKTYTSPDRRVEERRELWSRRVHQTARVNHKFRRVRVDATMYYVPKNERIHIRRTTTKGRQTDE